MIHIEQIRPELTWRLRHKVLYPGEPMNKMGMEEDNDGYHFAAFKDNYIVGVVSLFINGADFQFRKFAVNASVQGQGIGTQLLEYITGFARAEGAERLWCNARMQAIGFYARFGFTRTGESFSRGGLDYVIMTMAL